MLKRKKLARWWPMLLFLALPGVAWAQGGSTQPNCVIRGSLTGPAAPQGYQWDNRSQQCVSWTLSWSWTTGATVVMALQVAVDNGGVPGSWTTITADSTVGNAQSVNATYTSAGYWPWVRANVAVTGSGAVQFLANGFITSLSKLGGSGGGGTGSGTVTSVGLNMPAEFSVSGTPVTTSGTLLVTKAAQSANLVFAGPASGVPGLPTFRALVAADIPGGGGGGMVYPPGAGVPITTGSGWGTTIAPGALGHFIRSTGTSYADSAIQPGDLPLGTTTSPGALQPDGSTITVSGGVISAAGGGGGSSTTLTALQVTTSGTTLTIGSACTAAAPCNVMVGNTPTPIQTGVGTITGGSGTSYIYISSAGQLTVGSTAGGVTVNCTTGCQTAVVGNFPANSIWIATVQAASGVWGTITDYRSFQGRTILTSSAGIILTTNTNSTNLSLDSTVVGTKASGTATLPTGSLAAASCSTPATTVAAASVSSTDVIQYSPNTDPTALTGYSGSLQIVSWPSAGNVNFKVCNPTAGSITPGALTLNWKVSN